MATENWQINHPVATGAALDAGHHQGLFAYDTTTGKCRFQFGSLLANTKQLANVGDAPTAHKASHENGGSDALVGQNIAGLRTTDSPNFATSVVSGVTRISAGGSATLTGLTSSGGGTFTGAKTSFAPSIAAYASINLGGTGTAPTSPVDGDLWREGADGMRVRFGANSRTFMLSETTQTISGAKTFSALGTFNLGVTVAGAKTNLAPAAAGYASLRIPTRSAPVTTPVDGDIWRDSYGTVFYDRIAANNTTMPAWGAPYKPVMVGGYSSAVEGSGAMHLFCGFYDNGTSPVGLDTGKYATLMYISSIDGSLRFVTSNTTVTNGTTIADLTNKVHFSRQGGLGLYGVTAPSTRPTVNAACTDLATCIALTNQLRTHLIACGLVQ